MAVVSKEDGVVFGFAGLLAWMAASAFYLAFGGGLLERAFWFYVLNAGLTALWMTFVFEAASRLRRTPCDRRILPAMIFAAPGAICASTTLINFTALAGPVARPESAGRYGAFLLFGYALLLASTMGRRRKLLR
jgi:hypothetical protein